MHPQALSKELDELLNRMNPDTDSMLKAFSLFANIMALGDTSFTDRSSRKFIDACKKFNSDTEITNGVVLLAESLMLYFNSSFEESIKKADRAIALFINTPYKEFLGVSHFFRGACCRSLGEFDTAVKHLSKSADKISPNGYLAMYNSYSHYQLGEVNLYIRDFESSEKHFLIAENISAKLNNYSGMFRANNGLGNLFLNKGDYIKAKEYFEKSLSVEHISDAQLSRSYCDLGILNHKQKQYDIAKEFLQKSYEIRKQNGLNDAASTSLIALSEVELESGNTSKAVNLLNDALQITFATNAKSKTLQCYKLLAEGHERLGDYKNAIEFMKKYTGIQTEQNAIQLQNIYKLKNQYINEQKQLIEEYLKDIKDSIVYAKRIQTAILPGTEHINNFPFRCFVFYKPKDIVAGDFYWIEKKDEYIYIAAADCTGHGVPGAMVSVICNNGLNRALKEYSAFKPGELLNKTRELILKDFEKSTEEVKDGMDISLLSFNTLNNELHWSGANNPLWIIRNKANAVEEIKGDKQPVGKHFRQQVFTTHHVNATKGDMLYLFTDGFQDQFGGTHGKKFKASGMKELLLKIHNEDIDVQRNMLNAAFEEWKGELEQVDDVCVIGIRI